MKQLSLKELKTALYAADYQPIRTNGSHQIWSNGTQVVSVPIVNLKYIIAIKIVKQCGLKTLCCKG